MLNPASPASAATNGDNDRDNVEQIVLVNPTTNGVYTVRITHKGTLKNDTGTWSPATGEISATKTNTAVELPMNSATRFYRLNRVR